MRLNYEDLRIWIEAYWGLTLSRCGGEGSQFRCPGNWKTGWMVKGNIPGIGYTVRRYSSLSRLAKISGYDEKDVS